MVRYLGRQYISTLMVTTLKTLMKLSGTTDINGLFFVEKGGVTISSASKLISIGGTDTTTNKALPDLALVSDVPTAATASAYITPISTIIAAAATPAAKVEVLNSLWDFCG